jgi:DNA-directed RNA polymerase specialized sigma24 family protein
MPTTTNERWDLPETELAALHTRYKATRERRLADRILCVLLKAEKHWPHQEIAAFLGVHVDTVTDWLTAYLTGGIDRL